MSALIKTTTKTCSCLDNTKKQFAYLKDNLENWGRKSTIRTPKEDGRFTSKVHWIDNFSNYHTEDDLSNQQNLDPTSLGSSVSATKNC